MAEQKPEQPKAEQPAQAPEGESSHDLIKEGLAAMDDAAQPKAGKPKEPEPSPEDVKAKPAAVAPEEPTGPSAKGWAAVKKAEAKLRLERERFDDERKTGTHQLNQMRAEIEQLKQSTQAQHVDIKAAFSKDPFGTLKNHLGVTLNDLANMALQDGHAPQKREEGPSAEVKMVLEKLDKLEKREQQREQQTHIERYKSGIQQALGTEQYSLLQTMPNAEAEIIEVAALHLQRTGELLSPEKSAAILLKHWESHLSKIGTHAAARRVLGLPDPGGADSKPAPRPKGPSKTLNRQLSSAPPAAPSDLPNDLSEEQELRAAAKLIPDDAWDHMS